MAKIVIKMSDSNYTETLVLLRDIFGRVEFTPTVKQDKSVMESVVDFNNQKEWD